jgi:hypothetical protein
MFPNTPCPDCPPCPSTITPLPLPDLSDVICGSTYDSTCVMYTGNDINCIGILNGMFLDQVLQILSSNACTCCVGFPSFKYQAARLITDTKGGSFTLQPICDNPNDFASHELVYVYRPNNVFSNVISITDTIYKYNKIDKYATSDLYYGIQLLSSTEINTIRLDNTGAITEKYLCNFPIFNKSYIGTKHSTDPVSGVVVAKDQLNITQTFSNIYDNLCANIVNITSIISETNVVSPCPNVSARSYFVSANTISTAFVVYTDRYNVQQTLTLSNASLTHHKIFTIIAKSIDVPPVYVGNNITTYTTHVEDPFNCRNYQFINNPSGKSFFWEYKDPISGLIVSGSSLPGTPYLNENFDSGAIPDASDPYAIVWTLPSGVWYMFNTGPGLSAARDWGPSATYFTSTPSSIYARRTSTLTVGETVSVFITSPLLTVLPNSQLSFKVRRNEVGDNDTKLLIRKGYPPYPPDDPSNFPVIVKEYVCNGTDENSLSYDPITNPTANYSTWVEKIIDISPGTYYLAFNRQMLITTLGAPSSGSGIYIDDIKIQIKPSLGQTFPAKDYFTYTRGNGDISSLPLSNDTILDDNGYCI